MAARMSRMYVPTLKEAPGDAEVVSHKLLMRAGFIRKLTSGIYSYLPMGLKALNKVADIVREEMNRAGAQEILMPMVQPAELWSETGRWQFYGKELLRIKDRHERDFCLGPTHEEVVTDLVRGEIRSYRQLPVNLYQIQTKFRDEIRPRFGLMRGREFVMKDAYSFDRDEAGADASYWAMYEAYVRAFKRLGLDFRAVEADTGQIGGNFSHEFMVLAETGEDVIAACEKCAWAANLEKAEVLPPAETAAGTSSAPGPVIVPTPGARTIEEVAACLKLPPESFIKTLVFLADGKPIVALVRGDRELNEVKLKNKSGATELDMAPPEVVEKLTGAPVGFAGPIGMAGLEVPIYADFELRGAVSMVAGANVADAHVTHVDLARDVPGAKFFDLRTITAADPCPRCGGGVMLKRGIEVGHVFKLGTKYSEAMKATFLDEDGKEKIMVMGCYGIGVSRVVAACIEQNHDADGIVFPPPIAPYEVALLALDPGKEEVAKAVEAMAAAIEATGAQLLIDDRDERPGVKFKDADLIGLPMQLVLGGKGLARGVVEAKNRRTGERTELDLANFAEAFAAWRTSVREGWGL